MPPRLPDKLRRSAAWVWGHFRRFGAGETRPEASRVP